MEAGCTTEEFYCPVGLKQGECSSPLLFFLFNELATTVREKGTHRVQFVQGMTEVFLLLFADDVAQVSLTFADNGTLNTANNNVDNLRSDLQHRLNDISGWCRRNRMALNPTKTRCMLTATRQKYQKQLLPSNLNFETTPTEQVLKHRLLGVTVDEQLKRQMHINNICRAVSRNIFLLSKLSRIVSYQAKFGFFFAHIISHRNCFKCMGWMCLCAHEATVLSPQMCHNILNAKS